MGRGPHHIDNKMLSQSSRCLVTRFRNYFIRPSFRFFSDSVKADASMIEYGDISSAHDAWQKSCYFHIDFKIPADAMVIEAVKSMSAHKVGCLAVTKDHKIV